MPSDNWLLARMRADMPSTGETIAALLEPSGGRSDGTINSPRPPRPPSRPLSIDVEAGSEEECRSFATYLSGVRPSAYVVEQYVAAASAHELACDGDLSCFDRATLKLARSGPLFTRWADAYCAIVGRSGVLRRKLIVLAAILEHVAPTSDALDRVVARSVARTVVSLAGYGSAFAVSLLVGAVILLPASVLCWSASRSTHPGIPAGSAK